jgi:pimeloyl-ACP methyl ester carboxylesterase
MKLNYKLKRKNNTPFVNQFHGYQQPEKPTFKYDQITDSEGLKRAYDHGDYYIHGKTMFIAGSHTARDWFDDLTKIPVWGDLKDSERYQKVLEVFKNRGEINTVVGHSLGGSVSLELQKNFPDRIQKSRTYGAPVMNLLGSESENVDRYRNWFDPVSILDRGAKKSIKWNVLDSGSLTHDYSNIGDNVTTIDLIPVEDDED